MEEEARKLLEEGIRKKLISPGKGALSSFPNGTKVRLQYQGFERVDSFALNVLEKHVEAS